MQSELHVLVQGMFDVSLFTNFVAVLVVFGNHMEVHPGELLGAF